MKYFNHFKLNEELGISDEIIYLSEYFHKAISNRLDTHDYLIENEKTVTYTKHINNPKTLEEALFGIVKKGMVLDYKFIFDYKSLPKELIKKLNIFKIYNQFVFIIHVESMEEFENNFIGASFDANKYDENICKISIKLTTKDTDPEIIKKLLYYDKGEIDVKESIYHELLHAYDFSQGKHFKKRGETHLNSFIGAMKNVGDDITSNFFGLVYLSLKSEIAARNAQAYKKLINVENKEGLNDVWFNSYNRNSYYALKNFDAEDHIKYLKREMGTHYQEYIESFMKGINSLENYLQQTLNISWKIVPKRYKKSPEKFFKYWEKIFHKAAEKSKRGFFRMYSKTRRDKEKAKDIERLKNKFNVKKL